MTSERCYYESLLTTSRLSYKYAILYMYYHKIITKPTGDLSLLNENDQKIAEKNLSVTSGR